MSIAVLAHLTTKGARHAPVSLRQTIVHKKAEDALIARLGVATRFLIAVPEGVRFTAYTYEDSGYQICAHPPMVSNVPIRADLPAHIEIDGQAGFVANALRIDFIKDRFDLSSDANDPPREVISRAIDSFLTRYRYVLRAPQIASSDFPNTTWRLEYLNDDGSPVQRGPGVVAGRGGLGYEIRYVAITSGIWEQMHELEPDWLPPRWNDLLLDANGALPRVGTAVVLAATALEVFIADTLDELSAHADFPQPMWDWVNHRGDWLKDPSTAEQFDFLLQYFTGHSLKEESTLWESFQNLRTARNTFVHEGAATLGRTRVIVTPQQAAQLVKKAWDITEWVREKLPAEMQWPLFKQDTRVAVTMPLLPLATSQRPSDQPTQA